MTNDYVDMIYLYYKIVIFIIVRKVCPVGVLYTLRLAEVKWLFTSGRSKNGSLRPAEVKCIFTPGGRKAPLYVRCE